MKKLLYILLHPVEYYRSRKYAERIMLLSLCCLYTEIDDPCVYDVDKLGEAMQEFLDVMHYHPSSVAELGNAKNMLFWHLLISRFRRLSFPREEINRLVRMYGSFRELILEQCPDATHLDVALSVHKSLCS